MSEERMEIGVIVAEVIESPSPDLEAVRGPLLEKCRAIAEAVDDLADVIDAGDAACALDLSDAKSVRLYLVTDGWLHVFAGRVDPSVPVQSREALNPRFPSACEYTSTPITSDARFEYAFHGNAGPLGSHAAADAGFSDVVRTWTFHVGRDTVKVELDAAAGLGALHAEKSRFAHRLARLILARNPGPEDMLATA